MEKLRCRLHGRQTAELGFGPGPPAAQWPCWEKLRKQGSPESQHRREGFLEAKELVLGGEDEAGHQSQAGSVSGSPACWTLCRAAGPVACTGPGARQRVGVHNVRCGACLGLCVRPFSRRAPFLLPVFAHRWAVWEMGRQDGRLVLQALSHEPPSVWTVSLGRMAGLGGPSGSLRPLPAPPGGSLWTQAVWGALGGRTAARSTCAVCLVDKDLFIPFLYDPFCTLQPICLLGAP